jgi:uncharacterized membrane protein
VEYLIVKWLHILSSTLLFGTGIGSAYYMLRASLTHDARVAAVVVGHVVVADWLFTAPTAIFQPLSGLALVHVAQMPLSLRWVWWSLLLYGVAIACWMPVVWIQIRMHRIAVHAADRGGELPREYRLLLRWWVGLGVVAFIAFVAIFYLMVAKPL